MVCTVERPIRSSLCGRACAALAFALALQAAYDGVHYRFSTEVGIEMGRRIGALAAAKFLGD